MNRFGPTLVVILSIALNGCWLGLRKSHKQSVPSTPAPAATPAPESKPVVAPPQKPAAKTIEPPAETQVTKPGGIPSEEPLETLRPKPPKPPVRKPARKKTPPATTPPATVSPSATAPASAAGAAAGAAATPAVPQLGVLLTSEQRNQYEAEYSRDMASAMDGLIHVLEHSLSPAQKESMNRARSFMRQAEDAHGRDLATAAQLARRAAVLAQDLAQSQR